MTRTTTHLFAATLAATALLAGGAQAQYIGLISQDTINGGDGSFLQSGVIDGTTGYAVLGGGSSRIVKIDDIGGANIVSTLVDTATLTATFSDGSIGSGISGQIFGDNSGLFFLSPGEDEILAIDPSTPNTASVYVSESGLEAFVFGLTGLTGPGVFFGGLNPLTGNPVFYETDSDSIIEATAPDTFTVIAADTELAAVSGDDTISGLAVSPAGTVFFGQTTNPENVSFVDTLSAANGTLATEADILPALPGATDIGGSNTAFGFVDGDVVFYDSTSDGFLAIDSVTGAPSVIISEDALLDGPAASDSPIAVTSFGGSFAWVDNGVGFYVVPEPTSLAMLALAGLGVAARRR